MQVIVEGLRESSYWQASAKNGAQLDNGAEAVPRIRLLRYMEKPSIPYGSGIQYTGIL